MKMEGDVRIRMSNVEKTHGPPSKPETETGRKPYRKPEFRFELVFETMALACGKISPTQGHCRFRRRSS
jgi:hypothetical protein